MQAHHQSLPRPDSPRIDHHGQQQMQAQDNVFTHQNGLFSTPIPENTVNMLPEFGSDSDNRKFQHKVDGFPNGYRPGFSSLPNTNRPRPHAPRSVLPSSNPYRDPSSFYPASSADMFPSHLTSPQSHAQSFDARASFDFGGHNNINGIGGGPKPFVDLYNTSSGMIPAHVNSSKSHLAPSNQHSMYSGSFSSGLHLSSQTPFGPHVPSTGLPSSTSGPGVASGAPAGLGQSGNTSSTNGNTEEISTIFVVGFPEDMQEREFQNMFTFSPGFEAATLKIPNKEYTSYGGVNGGGGLRNAMGSFSYGGPNDPYNLVTVNQGGVVVDAGRDGTMTSWPASAPGVGDEGGGPHFLGGGLGAAATLNIPPRKQIIGFAKFRTREEALNARDVLQGRRVDIDKGAVLKAEMAKKNLHTKRGVGPVSTSSNTAAGSGNPGVGNPGGPQQASMMSVTGIGVGSQDLYVDSLGLREKELGTLGSLGSGRLNQWRDQVQQPEHMISGAHSMMNGSMTPGREQDDDRRAGAISAIALPSLGAGTRGPRERAEDEERERRRKEKEMQRLRATNANAFDAFHSVTAGPSTVSTRHMTTTTATGMLSPSDTSFGNGVGLNGFGGMQSQTATSQQQHHEEVGPWDNMKSQGTLARSGSRRSTSPSNATQGSSVADFTAQSYGLLTDHYHDIERHDHRAVGSQAKSSPSSITGGSQRGGGDSDTGSDGELSLTLGGLEVSTDEGKTSPQLPSPASGASSRNGVDQNPPINTLYVGNLPTSPPPPGLSQNYLEDSLRDLFSTRAGFRRLCFRQKSNGPMCFVEFEDVQFATRALNDLYGNDLIGLVKGGIRLSYSKNPLGVRTPTSATGSGSSQPQPFQHSNNSNIPNGIVNGSYPSALSPEFKPRTHEEQQSRVIRRDAAAVMSQPPAHHSGASSFNTNFLVSPPPRFVSSSPAASASFGTMSGTTPLTGASNVFMPRSAGGTGYNILAFGGSSIPNGSQLSSAFSPFGPSSSPTTHSSIPDASDDHSHSQHFVHRTMSPPINALEATRAS